MKNKQRILSLLLALALVFSLLAASEILPFHPILDRIHELNPVPPWATEYYVVALLGLMVLSWVYGGRVKHWLWNGLRRWLRRSGTQSES